MELPYGRRITRLGMLSTEGILQRQVTREVKKLFIDYLFQLEQFGKIQIKRNHGLCKDPRKATPKVYFDAGE